MGNNSMVSMIVMMGLVFVAMYFLMIRPQKKKQKTIDELRKNVRVGDEIVTIGGICGLVVKTMEESLIIQVGADRTKFEIKRWAVSQREEGKQSVAEEDEPMEEAPRRALPKRMKSSAEKATEEIEK